MDLIGMGLEALKQMANVSKFLPQWIGNFGLDSLSVLSLAVIFLIGFIFLKLRFEGILKIAIIIAVILFAAGYISKL